MRQWPLGRVLHPQLGSIVVSLLRGVHKPTPFDIGLPVTSSYPDGSTKVSAATGFVPRSRKGTELAAASVLGSFTHRELS